MIHHKTRLRIFSLNVFFHQKLVFFFDLLYQFLLLFFETILMLECFNVLILLIDEHFFLFCISIPSFQLLFFPDQPNIIPQDLNLNHLNLLQDLVVFSSGYQYCLCSILFILVFFEFFRDAFPISLFHEDYQLTRLPQEQNDSFKRV